MTEIADIYEVVRRKARKAHQCYNCRGRIEPGEIYHIHQSLFEGEWWNRKMCRDCQEMLEETNRTCSDPYEQVTTDDLWDDIFSRGNDSADDLARRLIAVMQKRGAAVPEWISEKWPRGLDETTTTENESEMRR